MGNSITRGCRAQWGLLRLVNARANWFPFSWPERFKPFFFLGEKEGKRNRCGRPSVGEERKFLKLDHKSRMAISFLSKIPLLSFPTHSSIFPCNDPARLLSLMRVKFVGNALTDTCNVYINVHILETRRIDYIMSSGHFPWHRCALLKHPARKAFSTASRYGRFLTTQFFT